MAGISRRGFLRNTAAVSSAAAIAALGSNFAHAAGSDLIKIGVIGCGGRGSGATLDCAGNNDGVQIVALGDMFKERIENIKKFCAPLPKEKFNVSDDKCFLGFDAYKKVIDSGVDMVILATPPGFRPGHIAAAVEAGKHIFAEKPCGVDPVGVRSVLASAEKIDAKKLAFVCGTQRRHDPAYQTVIQQIHDGALGDVVSAYCYWNQGGLWMFPREKAWSDMEWQLRNWLYFTWLSGDHIVEQHVHNVDVCNWAIGDHPISAYGMGGRQVRTDAAYGHIFDHFAIEYEYEKGARVTSMCRQIDGTDTRVSEFIVGTKGKSDPSSWIKGEKKFKYKKPATSPGQKELGPYQQEHVDLITSIRSGKPLNEAKRIAETTLTAIMGRMSAYTGKTVTWEQAMNSQLNLMPEKLEMGPIPVPPVAMPGKDQLV